MSRLANTPIVGRNTTHREDRNSTEIESSYSRASATNNSEKAPDRGGVRIPTIAEFQQEQQNKRLQFFQEQQRATEIAAKRRQSEDIRRIEELHKVLTEEIKKFEKVHKQINVNLEKAKKILLEEQSKIQAGNYHVTFAEVLQMVVHNAFADADKSNNWLEALVSRKKRRGSLFATQSKTKGTSYSLSQELALARSSG